MRKFVALIICTALIHTTALADGVRQMTQDGPNGHWIALNQDYIVEIIDSMKEVSEPQSWDSQAVIQAKIRQLDRFVKSLKFFASEKSKLTIKAMKIMGLTDTTTAKLRPIVASDLKEFAAIKSRLEAALEPEDDDSDLVE